jgi:hypothetical protein
MHHGANEASEWDELQARSLVFAEIDGPQERLRSSRNLSNTFRWRNILVLIVLAIFSFSFYMKEDVLSILMLNNMNDNGGVESEKAQKDRLDVLMNGIKEAKIQFDQVLEQDYGKYKDDNFDSDSVLKAFKSPSHVSIERLQRRILIKILEAQLIDGKNVEFNWLIGGHSAAAGHGNLFEQTYGYVLEESAKPIFKALGIDFYGKNYAMGGMKSAPASALCMSELFGPDLDILSWDYGMTDGSRSSDLYNIWSQRAGVHPTKPTLVSFHSASATHIHPKIEDAGMSAFEAVFVSDKVAPKLPDSDDPDVDVESLPRGVKYYMCKGRRETNEPCSLNKWATEDVCPKMKYQVNWHDGWKNHMFKGRMMAAFMIENVFGALYQLVSVHEEDTDNAEEDTDSIDAIVPSISMEYLNHLYSIEKHEKEMFLASEVPSVPHFQDDLQEYHDIFLRSKSSCRMSYLPSYARYEGLVTEQKQTSLKYVGGGRTTYENEGFNQNELPSPEKGSSSPLLVYNFNNDRDICDKAEIDFKDYYRVHNDYGWMTTVVPNESEYNAFNKGDDSSMERVGLIALCPKYHDFSRLPPDYASIESLVNSTDTNIIVNDVAVDSVRSIGTNGHYCYVLSHDNGTFVFPPSERHGSGRYEIKLRTSEKEKSTYFSAFIVI